MPKDSEAHRKLRELEQEEEQRRLEEERQQLKREAEYCLYLHCGIQETV